MQIIVAAITAWFIAQMWKLIAVLMKEKRLDLRLLFASGGMPSSHAALVTAATTKVALTEGLNSPLFAVCLIFSLVVMYDAAGVRQAVGIQAQMLNQLIEDFYATRHIDVKKVKEILGHTAFQVIVGMLIGVAIGFLPLF